MKRNKKILRKIIIKYLNNYLFFIFLISLIIIGKYFGLKVMIVVEILYFLIYVGYEYANTLSNSKV